MSSGTSALQMRKVPEAELVIKHLIHSFTFIIQFLSSVLKENQLSHFKRMADTVMFDVFALTILFHKLLILTL